MSNKRRQRSAPSGEPRLVSREAVVHRIAAHYADRTAYIIASGPDTLTAIMGRLPCIPGAACYLDMGDSDIFVITGHDIQRMPGLMELVPPPVSPCGVLTVPKTVPAAVLAKAVRHDVPADGSRDLLMLSPTTGRYRKQALWPTILIDAIERSDPRGAMSIRAADLGQAN